MDPERLRALTDGIDRIIARASQHAQSVVRDEHVGTAADDMITATIAEGELQIGIHVLAKRRMERDEIAAAVMEAVADAERQMTAAPDELFDEVAADQELDPMFRDAFAKVMQQIGPILRRR